MKNSKRVLAAVLAIVAGLLISVVGFYFSKLGMLQYSDGSMGGDAILGNEEEVLEDQAAMEDATQGLEEQEIIAAEGEIFQDQDVFNILLIGTDERSDSFSTNARGDSCMILSLNKKDGSARLVSLERGMGVPVLKEGYDGQYDWFTHTFRYGGADLMMKEVRECLKVDVHHYVRVNFNTFQQGIEAIGGIDVELTAKEAEYVNGFLARRGGYKMLSAGMNHLDGYGAITYARCRKIDSDWRRIERQRNVVQAAVDKTMDMSVPQLNNLLNQVLPLVQTNLSQAEITSLLLIAPRYRGVDFDQMTIPVDGTFGSMTGMGGRTLFAVDFATNAKILQDFLYGTDE